MKDKLINLIECDLASTTFSTNDICIKHINYSEHYHKLIIEWVSKKLQSSPISVYDYLTFKNDLMNMLIAEIHLLKEQKITCLWLINDIIIE